MADAVQQVLKDVLIVDEDRNFLDYMSKLLGKYYNTKTEVSSESALALVQNGYRPVVIIASQQMPGMTGAQFLAETIKFLPESVRVMLTSFSEAKDIVPGMNLAKAYIYIKKPADDLAIIQSIRNGINYYDSLQKNKAVQKNLNLVLTELKKLKAEPPKAAEASGSDMMVPMFYELLNLSEQYYFSYHTQNVVNVVKTLAEEMHLSGRSAAAMEQAARIHLITNLVMPDRFRLTDPYELDEEEDIEKYFTFFNKPLSKIRHIKELDLAVRIIEQMWERYDGTGYPHKIKGEELNIESQILAMAVIFDNQAYRLPFARLGELRASSELIQTQVDTQQRVNEALKVLYRNISWFDKDLMRIFTFVEKNKVNSVLVPKRGDLKLRNRDFKEEKLVVNATAAAVAGNDKLEMEVTIGEKTYKEKVVLVEDLKAGMIMGSNVVSKAGMLIVKREQKLTEGLIQNIQQLQKNDSLREDITILLPA